MKKEELVTISKFNRDGEGVGQQADSEKSWNVRFTVPGDEVRIQPYGRREGRLLEVIQASPERVTPRCVHFAMCGGCQWQMLEARQQLQLKEAFIQQLFEGLGGELRPILASKPWQYRNKMEFSFSGDKAGLKYLGLMMAGGRGKVFNLQECWLVNPWFATCLQAVRMWWEQSSLLAFHPPQNSGSLRTLTMREGLRTGDRLVMLTVSGEPTYALKKNEIAHFVEAIQQSVNPEKGELSIYLRIHQQIKGKPTEFYEMHLAGPESYREELTVTGQTVTFSVSPSAFFQPNPIQAETLYSQALQLAELQPRALVYDLYCGTGTLGIIAALHGCRVLGIELSPESSLDARENAKANHLEGMEVITGSVGSVLASRRALGEKPDLVMVDPPRVGLEPAAIEEILMLAPPKILYISCNPKTQALNAREFLQQGYQLQVLQPVDQFPQTTHVENIALFVRQ